MGLLVSASYLKNGIDINSLVLITFICAAQYGLAQINDS